VPHVTTTGSPCNDYLSLEPQCDAGIQPTSLLPRHTGSIEPPGDNDNDKALRTDDNEVMCTDDNEVMHTDDKAPCMNSDKALCGDNHKPHAYTTTRAQTTTRPQPSHSDDAATQAHVTMTMLPAGT